MTAPGKLDSNVRSAAWTCLLLSAFVGLGAATESSTLLDLDPARAVDSGVTGQLDPRLVETVQRVQLQTLAQMRGTRLFVLLTLSFTCGLAFLAATRLLWPGPFPRERMRRIAGFGALASGALRTVDGAMQTSIMHRVGVAIAKLEGPLQGMGDAASVERVKAAAPQLLAAAAIVQTAVVAGLFVLLGQYLRSERARKLVEAADAPAPASDG